MDIQNPVVKLCMEGIRAEFENRIEDARRSYQQAWEARSDDYDACLAAHYVARFQRTAEEALRWNLLALEHAYAVKDGRVQDFFPSLYLSLRHAYERIGGNIQAQRCYRLAASLGLIQPAGEEDEFVGWLKRFFIVQPYCVL